MATLKAANVTKFDAGGSGDNIISDGYIRAVEKVWIDSYTMAQTGTNSTLHIASLPANKKITSVDVLIETTASQTDHTISLGFSTDSAVDTLIAPFTLTHNLTKTTIAFPFGAYSQATATSSTLIGQAVDSGFQFVTGGTQTVIALKLNNWTSSSGTVKSIVRYT